MEERAIPGRLEVILKNVLAAREVYKYISDGLEEDLETAKNTLVAHLSQAIRLPPGWHRPYLEDGIIRLRPERKWKGTGKKTIAIHVYLAPPVAGEEGNQDLSVNLHVPFSGRLRQQFTDSLRQLVRKNEHWKHIQDVESDEDDEYPMFQWIRYESFGSAAGFEITRFFDAIASAVNELLQLEDEIDRLLEDAKVTIKTSRLKNRRGPQRKRPKKPV